MFGLSKYLNTIDDDSSNFSSTLICVGVFVVFVVGFCLLPFCWRLKLSSCHTVADHEICCALCFQFHCSLLVVGENRTILVAKNPGPVVWYSIPCGTDKGMRALYHENVPSSLPLVPSSSLIGHDGPVETVIFTPDGKYCLTGGHDRTVRLWNPFRYDPAFPMSQAHSAERPPPAMPIQTYTSGYTHAITSVTTTESRTAAQVLVAASQKTLVISDLITQQLKRRLQGHHSGTINAVAAARHAEAYLSASYDGTVAIWDGRSSDYKPIQVLKDAKDSVTDVHVVQCEDDGSGSSMNEAKIRTASVDGVVRTYDLRRGLVDSDDCGSPITSMAPTKDGECLVVSCLDGTIRLLQVDSGELLNTYTGHKAGNYGLGVGILANDSTIVSASEDGTCVLSDLVKATRVQALVVSPGRPTCSIATHPKISSVIVTASYDETTTVWSHDSSQFFWE